MSEPIVLETLIDRWYASREHAIGFSFNDWCERQPELARYMVDCECCGGFHLDISHIDCRAFYPQRVRD